MKWKLNEVEVVFTGLEEEATVPSWADRLKTRTGLLADVTDSPDSPGVVVVSVGARVELKRYEAPIRRLSERLWHLAPSCRVVIGFNDEAAFSPESLAETLLILGPGNANRCEFSFGPELLAHTVHEALAKYIALEGESDQDPLASAKEVIEVTRPLLAESGRLSAHKVAEAFGISLSRLAELGGRQKQALSKTPDSPRLQEFLRPFERVARLRSVFPDEDFRAWLRRPMGDLGDQSPLDLILSGRIDVVADYAEDMLLGTPA